MIDWKGNKMIKIAICDDDNVTLLQNEVLVKSYLGKLNIIAEIETYSSSEFLQYDIQENKFFDLLLMDIEMPGKSGMDIAREVKKISPESLIIFITSHSEYAIDSFELSVFRYIPKDNIDEKLFLAVKDALTYIELQKDKTYVIATPTRYEKIPYNTIFYIQKDGKYSLFTTDKGETQIRKSLSQVYHELDPGQFVYIDRGCIVNLLLIMRLDDMDVIMKNGVALPISKKRLKELKKIINEFWGEQL